MKKLLGVIVLALLLSGNGYAEIITFSKCYNDRNNSSKFRDDRFEKREKIININKGTIENILILTDKYFKELQEKNSGQPKYLFSEDKISSFNKYFVVRKKVVDINSNKKITYEDIYDLKTKRIQLSRNYHYEERLNEVFFIQCQ